MVDEVNEHPGEAATRDRCLKAIRRCVPDCRRCVALRQYCAKIAQTKRRAFERCEYWGRPVPSFGDPAARIVIIGLAPAAHGANRTGRMFTGDRSGDFLYAALHRAQLANQPTSTDRNDGLELRGVYITAALRCAPPGNKPTPLQLTNCRSYLIGELEAIRPPCIICLGAIAWSATLAALAEAGAPIPKPRPRFAHGAECRVAGSALLGCYHVSQQNTFTGRLTPGMLDAVLRRAKRLAGSRTPQTPGSTTI